MATGPVKRYDTDKGILKLNDQDAERLGFKKPAKADDVTDDDTAAGGRRRATSKKRPAPTAGQ